MILDFDLILDPETLNKNRNYKIAAFEVTRNLRSRSESGIREIPKSVNQKSEITRMPFKALWVTETEPGKFERKIVDRYIDDLPAGEMVIRVHYSSLNYKDALSATGNKGITREFPHTPGIDAAGVIEISRNEQFAVGDEVLVTGYDLGMNTCGGYGQYIRVPASWVVKKPANYSLKECMTIGTAGFTAACAVYKMELMKMQPGAGPIVVTGRYRRCWQYGYFYFIQSRLRSNCS